MSSKRADHHNVCPYAPESDHLSYWNQNENHSPDKGIVVEDRHSPARSDPARLTKKIELRRPCGMFSPRVRTSTHHSSLKAVLSTHQTSTSQNYSKRWHVASQLMICMTIV